MIPTLFQMDAVRLGEVTEVEPWLLMPHLVQEPLVFPGHENLPYAVFVDAAVSREVEAGLTGETHLQCLVHYVQKFYPPGNAPPRHLRTDGIAVWDPS